MIKINAFKDDHYFEIDQFEKDVWVNLVHPNETELQRVANEYKIDIDDLKAPLDEEEISRIEFEEDYTMILFDIPTMEERNGKDRYVTIPMGVFILKYAIITVCLEKSTIFDFTKGRKSIVVNPAFKTRFLLTLLLFTCNLYLKDLHSIYRQSEIAQKKLHDSTKNSDLIDMMEIGQSLIYFNTSLKSANIVLEKILKAESIKKFPDDEDLLEDVIVELEQAMEVTEIYNNILNGMMDANASIINNNMNEIMRFLAIATIVLSIPNVVFGAYGMNIADMPLTDAENPFWIIVIISVILSLVVAWYFRHKKMR